MTEKFLKQISGKMLLCVLALLLLSGTQIAKAQVPKSGNLNQIAILIELQDSKFSNPQSIVDALNGPTTSSLSLDNYIRVASAGKVTIQSHFPKDGSNLFIAKLPYTSADFYQQGSSFILDFNIILKAAVESVKNKFPTGVNFDINNDNLLDIVSVHLALKQPNPDIGLFNFYTQFYPWDGATINGKSIRDVIVNFYENPEGIAKANAGQEMLPVTAHELMHAFGTGEYYYFESAPLWKISLGHWDIMAGSSWTPMILPSAHIRGRLGWIDIPEITTAGRYTLHPATSGRTNGVAYKILTNADPTGKEYTVIEYRRFGGEVAIDGGMYFPNLNNKYASMYGSGLVIYKVNTNFDANNTDFRWDNPRPESEVIRKSELIAYRPDMTPEKFERDGNFNKAYDNLEQSFFSGDVGRTAFTPNTNPYPFADEVHITAAEGCRLQVFSAAGVIVHTQKITLLDETLRLSGLPEGVYFFLLDRDGKTQAVKVVKGR